MVTLPPKAVACFGCLEGRLGGNSTSSDLPSRAAATGSVK